MDIAVIGAGGTCGRQLCMQLLERRIAHTGDRLQLVTRRGGTSETELWGLRADLQDAFDDWGPTVELVFEPGGVDADIIVMMAGATVSTDPGAETDRAALARHNAAIFVDYADAAANRTDPPIVVVQSNPVELAVSIFGDRLPPQHVLGAGAWSDSLRFAREVAADLGVSRRDVQAVMFGQHGDHLVPLWSKVDVRGLTPDVIAEYIATSRGGFALAEFPQRVRAAKLEMIELIRSGHIGQAFEGVQALPADLRAAVKPFFTHFTAGRTTEAVTARSAADLVGAFVNGLAFAVPAQVVAAGNWADELGLTGTPIGLPVILGRREWAAILPVDLAADEATAMQDAAAAINRAIAEVAEAPR